MRAAVAAAIVAASASLHLPATAPAINELLYWKRLPLLKFPSHDALLPGEERQVHLYEPALVRLFERELGPDGVVGQQLDSAVTPLLKVAEFSPHEERGWWMRLCCIGRVEA